MNKKMADVDLDQFGEHESRPEEPTDECIPLDLVGYPRKIINLGPQDVLGPVGPWELEREWETSFRGTSVLHKEYLVGEIYELIGDKTHQ